MKSENAALRMVDIGVISRTASLALSLRGAALQAKSSNGAYYLCTPRNKLLAATF